MRLVEQLSKAQAQAAIERLMGKALARVEKELRGSDAQLAIKCAFGVLDRSLGLPMQRIDASITTNETATLVTPEMLRLAAMRLLATQATDAQEHGHADR